MTGSHAGLRSVVVVAACLVAACAGGGSLDVGPSDASSLEEWRKDPGKLGERWRQKVGGHLTLHGAAVDTDRVYVSMDDGIAALDLESGDEVWRVDLVDVGQPPVVAGERVLIASDHGTRLRALDRTSGAELWVAAIHTAAVAGNAVVVSDVDGVAALDPHDGHQLWRNATAAAGDVLVDGTLVFVTTNLPTELIALDGRTGSEVWRQPVVASRQTPRFFAAGDLVFVVEAGAGDDQPARVQALHSTTGRPAWEATLPAATLTAPVRVDDVIVFSTGNGARALQLADGRERFAVNDQSEYPRVAGCGDAACVVAVDLQLINAEGEMAQEIALPEISILPPAAFLNVIVVLDTQGTVYRYR